MDHTYETPDIKPNIEEEQLEEQTVEEEQLFDDQTLIEEQTIQVENSIDDIPTEDIKNVLDETADIDIEKVVKSAPGGLGGPNNFYTKLINLVRSFPNIYDKFDAGFKSPSEREKSWMAIARSLNTTVSFAQNRWTRLRERFAREKKALDMMQKTGNINDRKRLWPYFLPMLFLSSHIKSRRTSGPSEVVAPETLSNDMTVSKFLAVMGEKLKEESGFPSTSSIVTGKEVEVIDEHHPDYVAWRKRKPETSIATTPRKILAKPDTSLATVMITTKGKDGESKILTKLPPGAVLLKNAPGAIGGSPVVLVPTTPPAGVTVAKTGPLPMLLSAQQAAQFAQTKDLPIPNSAEHHFGMLIARELERFPKEVRAKKKQRILMVLYE